MSIFHNCVEHFEAVPSHTRIALNKSGAADADNKNTGHLAKLEMESKTMKIKIKFGKETRFSVPTRHIIRTWTQLLFGTRHTLHSLAMNERPKPTKPKLPRELLRKTPVRICLFRRAALANGRRAGFA
jgi:hypothetical protein